MDLATRRDGVTAKLRRASEHLLTITQEQATYVVTEEYGPKVDFEESIPERGGQPGLVCRANLKPDPPPRLGVLCGDIVHNLRSALDHLANALVIANGGTRKEGVGGTQFPIRIDGGVRIDAVAGGMSSTAQRILERVQPLDETESLAVLNRLSNIDKHRTLNIVVIEEFFRAQSRRRPIDV